MGFKIQEIRPLPMEMDIILQTLNQSNLSLSKQKDFKEKLQKINQYLQDISPDEATFIIKSTTYREILETPVKTINTRGISEQSLKEFQQKLEKSKYRLNAFTLFIFEMLQADLSKLINSPFYKETQQNVKTQKALELLNKQKILSPWFEFLYQNPPALLNAKSLEIILNLLEQIQIKLYLFKLHTPPAQNLKKGAYITISDEEAIKVPNTPKKEAQDIVKKINVDEQKSPPKDHLDENVSDKVWVPDDQ